MRSLREYTTSIFHVQVKGGRHRVRGQVIAIAQTQPSKALPLCSCHPYGQFNRIKKYLLMNQLDQVKFSDSDKL